MMPRRLLRCAITAVIASVTVTFAAQEGAANAVTEHTVSGIVLGDGQGPLAGATVTLTTEDGAHAVHTVTDGHGSYDISVVDGTYAASFAAPGYMSTAFAERLHFGGQFKVAGHDVGDVSAQLTRPATVSGRVTVAGKGATVYVEGTATVAGKDFSDWSAPDGSFRFTDVTPGTYNIGFRPPSDDYDFATIGQVVVGSGQSVTLATKSIPALSGYGFIQVTDDADRASSTTIPPYAEFGAYTSSNPLSPARTSYVVDPPSVEGPARVRPGRYKIALDSNTWIGGRSFLSASSFTVQAGLTTKVTGSAHRGVAVDMDVRNERGEPLSGIQAMVRHSGDPTELVSLSRTASSQGAGRLQIDGLPAGAYVVNFVDPTGEYLPQKVTSNYGGSQPQRVTLKRASTLAPTVHHDGTAAVTIDSTGAIRPSELAFFRYDDDASEVSTSQTSDSETGQVTYSLEPGKYRIRLSSNAWYGGTSFATATVVDLPAGQLTRLSNSGLAPFGWFKGWVGDDAGMPVDNVWVTVYRADDATHAVITVPVSSQFSIDELPVAPYKFRIGDPSGRYAGAWIGGGSSFATAKSWVPDVYSERSLGQTTLSRRFRAVSSAVITGTTTVGHTLQSNTPVFSRPASISRRWYRDGHAISGATGATYRLVAADRGRQISVRVTGHKAAYGDTYTTSARTTKIS